MHNYFVDITQLAERSSPSEICGFLSPDNAGSLSFTACRNIAASPVEEFQAHFEDVALAYKHGVPAAFVHSHCQHGHEFSEADIAGMENSGIPWFLYSTKTRQFNFRRPIKTVPPLIGRSFVLGLRDCVAIVADYYELAFGVRFPFFVRTWETVNTGFPLDCSFLQNAGFSAVQGQEPVPNDIVLMAGRTDMPVTHVGVVLNEGLLLHQVHGKISGVEQYKGSPWQRMTRLVFRHPEFTSKLSMSV